MSFGAVIAAAGASSRMGGGASKTLMLLCGSPVISYSLRALDRAPEVEKIVIVCREEDIPAMRAAAQTVKKPVAVTAGGAERQESVLNGAAELDTEYILIHDAARPLLTGDIISRVCAAALEHGAAAAAVPVKDTCKLADGQGVVESTPPRDKLWAVQTPQAFRRDMYLYAAGRAGERGESYTDDCQLIEAAGGLVKLVMGGYKNIKLTTPEDLITARAFLEEGGEKKMRIGTGYDVHRLTEGSRLVLGGVDIPFEKGLLGHSDADVLLHAVSDAILGAAAMGDIGRLFPDTDEKYAGADSLLLLEEVCRVVGKAGYTLGNIDCTLIAQRPKIAPYIEKMRENIARACGVGIDRVSVKATTEEGLGFTGTGEGMAASAVALLEEN